ncbi:MULTISPECIES: V-type ATP synthase subunit F [Anaerococcus]|uniref:V-type ATP synthase subunit F n=1 Tax=Anaerococcus TaxID=165779 RepID=UPI0027BB046E|nr:MULTISPECIES: V-type ATP synthase subunit F [Anaerococcus]MDU2558113.1 V-type ATP synthase subunit F [Anaerococcus prevotii]MDU2585337.1 V-type ATP synthase subunit F [Anaerococcus prevotii]MDU3136225.1 V-type ATP synthase subunit F [Anaerococcus prevotii]
MKAKLISNDPSLNLMFRLGGIEIEQVDRIEESLDKFKTSVKDDNLAVLILSRTIYNHISKDVDYYRENQSEPLIVVIDG